MKQKEYFGSNSINNLGGILESESSKNIFLVTGKKSFEICGAQEELLKIFGRRNLNFTRFCNFSSNPKLEDIQRGYRLFKENCHDCIIGVGGGSSIDVAKSIKLFHYQDKNELIPLTAIPTTTGSGSEATPFIVYYIGKEKQSLGNSEVTFPDYVICDSQFTLSLPKNIAASTGMDALCQAIESYWSIHSTKESKELARQSIKMSIGNLEQSVNNPSLNLRENMLMAANLAGKAIKLTKTTACHSISYPITSYFRVPHGHAVGLTLAEILTYNSKCSEENCSDFRGADYVKKTINEIVEIFGEKNVKKTHKKIKNLMSSIGLEPKLSKLGITKNDREIIIQKGFKPERVKNNPRYLTEENLRRILKNIY